MTLLTRARRGSLRVLFCGLLTAHVGFGASGATGDPPRPVSTSAFPWASTPSNQTAFAKVAAITDLGRSLFFDPGLSASGRMACATCHDPNHGFGPANALPVQMGGAGLDQPGTRATPGLTYASFRPSFAEHFHESDDDGDESVDNGPTGGLNWDGGVDRLRDQAPIPLLAPNEMANANVAAIVAHVRAASYAGVFRAVDGKAILDDDARAFAAITEALEIFLQEPATFSSFSSKYDAFLRGQATLDQAETRGLAAFNDPGRGNCAHCHKSGVTASGGEPLFTDFGMIAIGVPRNRAIPANADPDHFDLGMCGPDRQDLRGHDDYCGLFMTPSLRNVALRQSFFHNGVIHSLRDAVAFYAERDVAPEKWYPRNADGSVRKYDDLPPAYQANINVEPPFNRHPGDAPPLSAREIADIVAFLRTLTDGFRPNDAAGAVTATSTR